MFCTKMPQKIGRLVVCAVMFSVVLTGCKDKGSADIIDIQVPSQTYAVLDKSDAKRFNMADLEVDGVKALSVEADVKTGLGNPITERTSQDGNEKTLFYDQMTVVLTKIDKDFVLTGIRITGGNWKIGRGLKVGQTKDDILKCFYRDEQCLNNNLLALDGETIIGKFLYGDFTLENLEKYSGKGPVEYGIINYNGYEDMETAQSMIYQYIYMEDSFLDKNPSQNDDFAQLDIEVGQNGVIFEISWYYYEEIKGEV